MSKYKDRIVDSYGDTSIMSFGANKHMSTFATYGAIVTDNDELAYRIERVRLNGKTGRDKTVEFVGMNAQSHEDKAVQCWLALKYFDEWQKRRFEIAAYYDKEFADRFVPLRRHTKEWNAHKYAIMFEDKFEAQAQLAKLGIESEPHYPNILPQSGNYPGAERFVKQSLSIPINAHMTDAEAEQVVDTVEQVWKNNIT